ncbi:PAP2-domain-containing protein [Auricularia subglabra TFB-10046 SS5]|nr:PAP2-domain-containing protein [Auricularia subglabra TFB-10046 SS5]
MAHSISGAHDPSSNSRPESPLLPSASFPHHRPMRNFKLAPKRRKYSVWFLVQTYAVDWVVSIVLAALFWYLGRIKGFRRRFSLTDTSIQYPYTVHERVPNFALALICGVAPALLVPVVSLVTERTIADLHSGWLGLLVSLAITGSVTNITKVVVGRPRPDLISRCQPIPGVTNAPVFGLVGDVICTQLNEKIMNDGWRSFPSGHSSLSFAGLSYLSFYLAGKLHLFDKIGSGLKAWFTIVPLMGAALVAISRTMDYRHHATDVLSGSLLGLTVAYFSYRQYFPPLNDPMSHRCYSPRRRGSMMNRDVPNGPAAPRDHTAGEEARADDGDDGVAFRDEEAALGGVEMVRTSSSEAPPQLPLPRTRTALTVPQPTAQSD